MRAKFFCLGHIDGRVFIDHREMIKYQAFDSNRKAQGRWNYDMYMFLIFRCQLNSKKQYGFLHVHKEYKQKSLKLRF